MRRLATTFVIASFVSIGAVVWGQGQGNGQGNAYAKGQDPFFDKNDDGEVIKVLPTPAAVHSDRDTEPTFAAPSSDLTVYNPSYGSGQLANHGGPQIPDANFLPIFWNSTVANATDTTLNYSTIKSQIEAFVTNFSGSADYSVITQYGTSSTAIDAVLTKLDSVVSNQPTKATIKDAQIRSFLSSLFSSGALAPSTSTIYGIYFPAGMRVQLQGFSCQSFCGYHGHYSYNGQQIKYAVFPYLNCSACKLTSSSKVADMLTVVTSHEIREAVTDPELNSWFDSVGYEADDKCAWQQLYQITGGFWVQPEFSNADGNKCVGYH